MPPHTKWAIEVMVTRSLNPTPTVCCGAECTKVIRLSGSGPAVWEELYTSVVDYVALVLHQANM